jgi:hypothetical protein
MDDLKLQFFKAQRELTDAKGNAEAAEKNMEEIKKKIESKPKLAMVVSEHALVQYMLRALKLDIKKWKDEMLSLCDTAGEPEEQNRNNEGMQYIYSCDGPNNTTLNLFVKDNTIVTCYITDKEEQPE